MSDAACTHQILVTVIDKLLLGGIVGMAAFLAKLVLERYKMTQALREAISKERFNILGPLWSDIAKIRQELTTAFLTCSPNLLS